MSAPPTPTWRLAQLVWASALPAHLKLTALAMVSFAHSETGDIFPGVRRVAEMVSRDMRRVRAHITELVAMGVFVLRTDRRGGGHRTATYGFDASALPARHPPRSGHGRPGVNRLTPDVGVRVAVERADATVRVSPEEPGHGEQETRTPTSENPDASVRRSKRDLLREEDQDQPAPPVCEDEDEDEDRDQPGPPTSARVPPFNVCAAIAKDAITINLQGRRELDLGAIAETFKAICARQGWLYDAETARKAIDAALVARSKSQRKLLEFARRGGSSAVKTG